MPRNFGATPGTAWQVNQHTFAAALFASQASSRWSNLQSGWRRRPVREAFDAIQM